VHEVVEAQEARVRAALANELVVASDRSEETDVLERRTLQAADLG
jgi:hypothetical protein